jgi:hypothetical protein
MSARFEYGQKIGHGYIGFFTPADPAKPRAVAPDIRSSAYVATAQPGLSAQTRTALAQAANDGDWNALFFSSPEFMRR